MGRRPGVELEPGSDASLEEALRFFRESLEHSPLHASAPGFARARLAEDPALRESLALGLEGFLPDAARWARSFRSPREVFELLPLAPNLAVLYFHRVAHALFERKVERLPDVVAALARWMTGVEIYYSARIGPAAKVIHGLGTVIGAGARIGHHFTVYQGVTVGDRIGPPTGLDQRPVIGDYVIACAGASILGPVEIGEKTVIAAHSVVFESLPSRCIAAGAPARIVARDVSDERFHGYWESFRG